MNMTMSAGFQESETALVFNYGPGETVVDKACSKRNAEDHQPVFYITGFKYGDEELTAKLPGTDPISKEDLAVVGFLGAPYWAGCGYKLDCELYIDAAAQAGVRAENNKGKTVPVEISIEGFDYNPVTKEYFKCAWSDQPLKAEIVGAPPHPKPYGGITEADVYLSSMSILFKDDGTKQTMNIAYDDGAKDTILVSEPRNA